MTPTDKLTKKQTQVLEFVTEYIRDNGYAPSYREIGEALGVSSTATVHEHIKNLEQKGYLSGEGSSARGLEVDEAIMRAAEGFSLPLMGLITAGEPIEAVEEGEEVEVPSSLVGKPGETYVLRVKGESMIEDGILSGDYVIVERNPSPRNGEIVVALLENTYATLKRLYKEKGKIRLQPANSTMKPIYVKSVDVQGVVRGVIRNYRSV
ncbi:MAG: transcriptional repressor LexA [Patescibacteria group bacterium]|nr:transcriptional repressor LexA [Patescibacteria group bacterium]